MPDDVPGWVRFHRADASAVIDLVREVATRSDPGVYGCGVDVVIEVPRRGLVAGLFDGRPFDDNQPEQARILVTRAGGQVRYPFHVQLITTHGGSAARLVPALPGWARSNSAGLAFLVQKGGPGRPYDWPGLVGGTIAALCAIRMDAPEDGWRARADRAPPRGN